MLKNGTSPCHDCYATTSRQGGPILKVCGDGLSIVAINLFVGRQNSFFFEIKLVFIKGFFFLIKLMHGQVLKQITQKMHLHLFMLFSSRFTK
jgi:hypothetical protein